MSRLIDADKLKEVLEKNFGHTGGASVLAKLIDAQDTIQPEPHWILCSDRLPEKDGRYIVSHRYLTTIVLGHPEQNVYEGRVGVDSYRDGRFFYHDSAVAWWSVPVPEPYKGVTECNS